MNDSSSASDRVTTGMWPSRLFWRFFAAYAMLILLATAVFSALMTRYQTEQLETYLRERLRDDAVMMRALVADDLAGGSELALRAMVNRLARETKTRITLIDAFGRVLADSDQHADVMENHGSRPEIEVARNDGIGVGVHMSRTLGFPMMYLALRVDRAGDVVGYVRVALTISEVESRVGSMRKLVWGIGLAVCLLTLAITYFVVLGLTRPLKSLTMAAQAIADEDYGRRVRVISRDEIGQLAETFNRMSADLNRRVTEIRSERELLATMLRVMVEGVVALDANQRILFANEAAQTMLSLGNQNVAGRPLWELVRVSAVQDGVQAACNGARTSHRFEFELPGRDRRVVAMHATRLPGDPLPGIVLVCHDISELRRLENLRREFVANVSHELKTPLASIKAYVETLLGGALHDSENNLLFLRRIDEQAERLHRLILDLLRLARVESGQELFDITDVPLEELVASCAKEYESAAAAKKITLETIAPDKPVAIRADPEGVRNILDNLIDNAVKYTQEGGRVGIRWKKDDSMALIEVSDSGIGIAPQDQIRIFERFYRVDKARSRDVGGTGLGLSIVKHLAQSFGGTVSVTSAVGRGSVFTVWLPVTETDR